MEYPNSPYSLVQRLIADLTDGQIAADEFLEHLAGLQEKLERGYTRLEELRPGDDSPQAQELVDAAAESLRMAYQGLEMLHALPGELQAAAGDCETNEVLEGEPADAFEPVEALDDPPSGEEPAEDEQGQGEQPPGWSEEVEAGLELVRVGCANMARLVDATGQDVDGLLGGLFGD